MRLLRVVSGNWVDPWGRATHVNKVMQTREVLLVEGETIPHDYGYGPENIAQCRVYVDSEGRKYQGIPPMDFGASTYFIELQPKTNKEAAKFWHASVAIPAITKKGYPCDRNGDKL